MKRRWISLGMAVIMAMPMTAYGTENAVRDTDFFEPVSRPEIHFNDMSREMPDLSSVSKRMNEVRQLAKNQDNAERVKSEYLEIKEIYEKAEAAYQISEIAFYQNPVENEEAYDQAWEDIRDFDDLFGGFCRDLLNSSCGESLKTFFSEDEQAYYGEFEEYETLNYYPYKHDLAFHMDAFEYEQMVLSSYLSEMAKAEQKGTKPFLVDHKYVNLWNVRQFIADANGYDNYAEYAYKEVYLRDYEPDDLTEYFREVKLYLVPLLKELTELENAYYDRSTYYINGSREKILDMMETAFAKMSDELLESLNYMREQGLYDINPDETKSNTGFTTYIDYYKVPFFFDQPYETVQDVFSVSHEMGHFNDYYWVDPDKAYEDGIDVAEIHSQALELLVTEHYDTFFGKDAEYVFIKQLAYIVDSVCYGALIGELENTLYRAGDMDVDKVAEQYCRLMIEYGYAEEGTFPNEMTDWIYLTHLYSMPCYYISYSVSAAAALQFWMASQENYSEAVDLYLEFVSLDGVPYQEALTKVDLPSPFDGYELRYMTDELRDVLQIDQRLEEARKAKIIHDAVMKSYEATIADSAKLLLSEPWRLCFEAAGMANADLLSEAL